MTRYVPLVAFIATVWLANWAIATFGVVPVGFGLVAPAAAYVAGLAFTLRDWAHETLGRGWVLGGIAAGAALSLLVSPVFALASAAAFFVSEAADYLVYVPLRRRGLPVAVVASNIVGLTVDSVLFLTLAFGSLEFLPGQVVGKGWVTLVFLPLWWVLRRRVAWA